MQECSFFSTSSPAFIVCRLFDDGHSDWCEVISHGSFDLHFSNNERCWASFRVFVSHLYVFFREMSCVGLLPHVLIQWFVFLVVSYMRCLYILAINPLSVVSFAIIFWGLSFHLAYGFLCCAKAFKLNQVPLVYFCFYFWYSRRWVIEDLALIYVIECSAYVFL